MSANLFIVIQIIKAGISDGGFGIYAIPKGKA
jgi:hypothetical protein